MAISSVVVLTKIETLAHCQKNHGKHDHTHTRANQPTKQTTNQPKTRQTTKASKQTKRLNIIVYLMLRGTHKPTWLAARNLYFLLFYMSVHQYQRNLQQNDRYYEYGMYIVCVNDCMSVNDCLLVLFARKTQQCSEHTVSIPFFLQFFLQIYDFSQ